jgi:chorismate mutase/prephenate dehydratase
VSAGRFKVEWVWETTMPKAGESSLDQLRNSIDKVDQAIIELLNERARLALQIGKIKGRDGKPFFTPERERQILQGVSSKNPGPLSDAQLASVFREIISAARAAEKPLTVSYWGPEGTFTHLAALQTFGASASFRSEDSIDDVFLAVERRDADYGVVPAENSIAGVVPQTLDMFPLTNAKICSECYVPIHHHLVSVAESVAAVKRLYSGQQPLAQCKRWLRENLPKVEVVDTVPTSLAARQALADPEGAAIANKLGAEAVGIPILAEHIQDSAHNRTRFLVIGFNEPAQTGRDKTSLMFNLRNKPGELYRALGALVEQGVNLLMIESRPAPRSSFEYIFYIDCEGHRQDAPIRLAIERLKEFALETTVLGSYPAAE